jgi:hypothetical protein
VLVSTHSLATNTNDRNSRETTTAGRQQQQGRQLIFGDEKMFSSSISIHISFDHPKLVEQYL